VISKKIIYRESDVKITQISALKVALLASSSGDYRNSLKYVAIKKPGTPGFSFLGMAL
jgi:hypothetical protein